MSGTRKTRACDDSASKGIYPFPTQPFTNIKTRRPSGVLLELDNNMQQPLSRIPDYNSSRRWIRARHWRYGWPAVGTNGQYY